ncbi:MAG TPA: LysO family transporter [Thermoplasmata archaeon]|nr:LysO family transporter [Thermoplasmata archaeon]
MAVDPFLYVAFLLGFVAGRLVQRRSPWVERGTVATVIILLLLLGASLAVLPAAEVAAAIPPAVLFLTIVVALTLGVVYWLPRGRPTSVSRNPIPARRFPLELVFVAALVLGYGALGRFDLPWGTGIEWALYALLALVAFDLRLSWGGVRRVWVPLTAAVVGASGAAVIMTLLGVLSFPVSLATAFGFGWYTLSGPLVAAKVGPALGLVAFLTNFLRESVTMLSASRIGPRLGGAGVVALGGATSMDTTLYFANRYGESDAGALALATGLVLTISAGILLPALLSLPGA